MATATIPNPVFSAPADAGLFRLGVGAPAAQGAPAGRCIGPHLLGLDGVSGAEIEDVLEASVRYRDLLRAGRVVDTLRGVAVCLAFFEDSTRTRVSFELAAHRLGAMPVVLHPLGTSMSKGESVLDTIKTVVSMHVDLVVVRHRSVGTPAFLARHLDASVINAGDGAHEHPTQGLLDLLTLRDAWQGRFEGRKIAIVGDIAHSRVARSAIFGLRAMGVEIVVAGPPTLIPVGLCAMGCEVAGTIEDAMADADAVMALRIQRERMDESLIPSTREYARCWGVNARRVQLMRRDAVVLHPGPFNRDVEITSDVVDGPRSQIWRQVENGAAVRCAVLERCARTRGASGLARVMAAAALPVATAATAVATPAPSDRPVEVRFAAVV